MSERSAAAAAPDSTANPEMNRPLRWGGGARHLGQHTDPWAAIGGGRGSVVARQRDARGAARTTGAGLTRRSRRVERDARVELVDRQA